MRANIQKVIRSFLQGKPCSGDSRLTCSTDGRTIYSYAMPVAWRRDDGLIEVVRIDGSYTRTTMSHVRACDQLLGPCREHEDCRASVELGRACGATKRAELLRLPVEQTTLVQRNRVLRSKRRTMGL